MRRCSMCMHVRHCAICRLAAPQADPPPLAALLSSKSIAFVQAPGPAQQWLPPISQDHLWRAFIFLLVCVNLPAVLTLVFRTGFILFPPAGSFAQFS